LGETADCAPRDGSLLGMIVAWRVADETQVLELLVAPHARRTGLGRALLLAAWERSAQCRGPMVLEVRASNEPALGLYRKLGFEEVGRRRGYYGGLEDAVLMTRLPPPE